MLLTNNSIKIELFGKELILSERFARDVNKLIAFSKQKKEKDFTDMLIESAIAIEDGLKLNYVNIKWYNYFRKRSLKKQLSKENILSNLSSSQIFNLAKKIYEIEGFVPEEKKTPGRTKSGSADMSQ
ncbi:MAG: hypothetical protein AB1432_05480 [Bacteroidota bacterium]